MPSLIEHRKARFNYEILETFEAGIELFGYEVKALRKGQGTLEGAFVTVRGMEAYLINCQIPPYQTANTPKEYDPLRNRRLLLSKKELQILEKIENQKGLTIVPLSVYNKSRKIKLEIAVVKGKKQFDKRETTKKRETDREIRRTLKNQ